jgi:Lon protease-like protein
MVLPLHVFEPRYRALVHDIIEGDKQFGVVMIEKGLDTGGEDKRSSFGTVAEIIEAEEFPDGRWALITVGVERFRVTEWLADDPYPRAEIELWPDADQIAPNGVDFDRVAGKFRRCMALASEAGVDVGPVPSALDEGGLGILQMAAMLPVGPFDKQKLLGTAGSADRLQAVETSIDETLELIELRLTGN